jgi:AcrR family transcriptional regulator
MPKIRAENLEKHNEAVWLALTDALERLLAAKPYEAISFADIAAAAGLARNTIYNYAKDKPTLIARVAAVSSQALLDEITVLAARDAPPPQRLSDMLRAIVTWFGAADHRHLVLRTLFEPIATSVPPIAAAPLLHINTPVCKVVADGIASGDFKPVADVALTVELMAGVVHPAAIRVAHAPDQVDAMVREVILYAFGRLGCTPPE